MNKTTKIKTVLISIAGGFMILSALLYFLTPLLGEVSFDSFAAFGGGVVTLFTFDFHHPYFFPVFAFCVIAFVLNVWWVVVLLLKKRPKDLYWIIPVVVINILSVFFMGAYFLATVEVVGNTVDSLYVGILALGTKIVSEILTSISLMFLVGSLLFAGLFLFYDVTLSSFELKPEVKIVKVVETRVVHEDEYVDEEEDEYYARMIREMGMFHEGENN